MHKFAVWSGLIALALSACSRQHSAKDASVSSMPPAAALASPASGAPAATPLQRQEAGLAPTQPNIAAHSNADGSETEDAGTDNGAVHNPLLTAVAATMAAATASASAAAPTSTSWQEGVNYTRLVPAQPTSATAGQVEVLEFFWYGCPHCYAIDPMVESWKKTKPSYVSFSRVPVMWSEAHRSTARLFYTLQSLGKLEQMHPDVFKEIHVNNDMLVSSDPADTAAAERMQTAFVGKFGISDDAFKKAYHSFAVETDLQRADQLGLRYRVDGVPTFVINGKYVADVRSAGTPERLLSLVSDLSALERKH